MFFVGDVEEHDHSMPNGNMRTATVSSSPRITAEQPQSETPSQNNHPDHESPSKISNIVQRIQYYIPILRWLPSYKLRKYIAGDVIAGFTIGITLIPQGLAYAILAGVPPVWGLYSAISLLLVYFFLGTSRHLAVGPCALLSILVGTIIHDHNNSGTIEEACDLAGVLAFLVGVFTLIMGIIRGGFLENILSESTLHGFVTGVAFIIIFQQLDGMTGLPLEKSGCYGIVKIVCIAQTWRDINPITLLMGLNALIGLFLYKYIKGKVKRFRVVSFIINSAPGILIVIVVGTLFTWILHLDSMGLNILGNSIATESGFLLPRFPPITNLNYVKDMFESALMVVVVGFCEAVAAVKKYCQKYNYQSSSNRELVAFGVANLVNSFFHGYPAFASLGRSAINVMAGANTQLAALLALIIVALTVQFLLPFFYYLPKVVMSSIVVFAAFGLLEPGEIGFLWQIRAFVELGLTLLTFVSTFILGPELGILIAIAISLFLVIRHTSFPHVAVLGQQTSSGKSASSNAHTIKYKEIMVFKDLNLFKSKHLWFTSSSAISKKGILVIRIEESLYFANAQQTRELFSKIEHMSNMPLNAIVIDARNIASLDASALHVIHEMVEQYHKRDIDFCVVQPRPAVLHQLLRARVVDQAHLFSKIRQAVEFIEIQDASKQQQGLLVDDSKSLVVL